MAGRQHLGHAQQRARGGGVRERSCTLEAAQRLAVDRAAQAAQARLLAGTDAGRREDRLLDVALDDLVAEQADIAVARTAGARRVGDDATNLRKQRVPGREHDLAAAAKADLGQHEQRDAEHFETLKGADHVRVVFVRGAGETFCAGADIDWMRRGGERTQTTTRPTRSRSRACCGICTICRSSPWRWRTAPRWAAAQGWWRRATSPSR